MMPASFLLFMRTIILLHLHVITFSPWYYYIAHIVCIVYSLHADDDYIAFYIHIVFIIHTIYAFTVFVYFDITFCM
jgi:hypothetical protein